MRDFGLRGFTVAAFFTLALFRRERIIHGATYFEDAGERSLPSNSLFLGLTTAPTSVMNTLCRPTCRALNWLFGDFFFTQDSTYRCTDNDATQLGVQQSA